MEEQPSVPSDPPKMPNFFEVDKKKVLLLIILIVR